MKEYHYPANSPIDSVQFRQSIKGPEACVIARTGFQCQTMHLPDDFRKTGMTAEPTAIGKRPAVRVRGFTSEDQVLDTIAQAQHCRPDGISETTPSVQNARAR